LLKVTQTDLDGSVVNALAFKGTHIPADITTLANGRFFVDVPFDRLINELPECQILDVADDILILIIEVPQKLILIDSDTKLFSQEEDPYHVHVRDLEDGVNRENRVLIIQLWLILDVLDWKASFSPGDYLRTLKETIESHEKFSMKLDSDFYIRFFLYPNPTDKISDAVSKLINIVSAAIQETKIQLSTKLEDSIVTTFQFPESVSTSCEQYLLYFIQFLRDVGVEANSELRHEAGQVMFSVTPIDKNQALDKVRAALDAYLHLPSSPIIDSENNNIAVQRLESAVLRLRSDLKLAVAETQAKNATIEAQQISLAVYKGILSGDIVINSLVKSSALEKEQDREEVFDGLAAITVLKKEGFEINLPKLYRIVKDWFADK
jgi:hypothetical protein